MLLSTLLDDVQHDIAQGLALCIFPGFAGLHRRKNTGHQGGTGGAAPNGDGYFDGDVQ